MLISTTDLQLIIGDKDVSLKTSDRKVYLNNEKVVSEKILEKALDFPENTTQQLKDFILSFMEDFKFYKNNDKYLNTKIFHMKYMNEEFEISINNKNENHFSISFIRLLSPVLISEQYGKEQEARELDKELKIINDLLTKNGYDFEYNTESKKKYIFISIDIKYKDFNLQFIKEIIPMLQSYRSKSDGILENI